MFAELREFDPRGHATAWSDRQRLVTASDFCNLLVSRRRMVRDDEPGASDRGVLDPETGIRYVLDGAEYFRTLIRPTLG